MQTLSKYHYRKLKVTVKAVAYSLATVSLVGLGVFCFTRWDLSFMFTHWKGYVMLGMYSVITFIIIYATAEACMKLYKAYNGIPALGVGSDRFVLYDRHGLERSITFDDCHKVRIKKEFRYRMSTLTFKLIITYCDKSDPSLGKTRVEISLDELDQPQDIIAHRLMSVYNSHNKQRQA